MSIAAASVACALSTSAWAGPQDGMRADHKPFGTKSSDPRPPVRQVGRPATPSEQKPTPGTANLDPSALPPVPDPGLGTEPQPARPAARDLRTGDPRTGAKKAAKTDDKDDEISARPGAFAPAPTKMPSPLHKERVIAPHTAASPDLGVDLSKRSSVGVFGEVGRINREDIRTSTVKEGRDLGAGVTWQYKFDSR